LTVKDIDEKAYQMLQSLILAESRDLYPVQWDDIMWRWLNQ